MNRKSLANLDYEPFRSRRSFQEVPSGDDLCFSRPGGRVEGAEPFPAVVAAMAQTRLGLEVCEPAVCGETVLGVYDCDVGLLEGPIPTAEGVRVRHGVICEIELPCDGMRLRGAVG